MKSILRNRRLPLAPVVALLALSGCSPRSQDDSADVSEETGAPGMVLDTPITGHVVDSIPR